MWQGEWAQGWTGALKSPSTGTSTSILNSWWFWKMGQIIDIYVQQPLICTWKNILLSTSIKIFSFPQRKWWLGVCKECWISNILGAALRIPPPSGLLESILCPCIHSYLRFAIFPLHLDVNMMWKSSGVMSPRMTLQQVARAFKF